MRPGAGPPAAWTSTSRRPNCSAASSTSAVASAGSAMSPSSDADPRLAVLCLERAGLVRSRSGRSARPCRPPRARRSAMRKADAARAAGDHGQFSVEVVHRRWASPLCGQVGCRLSLRQSCRCRCAESNVERGTRVGCSSPRAAITHSIGAERVKGSPRRMRLRGDAMDRAADWQPRELQRSPGPETPDPFACGTAMPKLHARVADQLGLAIVRGDFKLPARRCRQSAALRDARRLADRDARGGAGAGGQGADRFAPEARHADPQPAALEPPRSRPAALDASRSRIPRPILRKMFQLAPRHRAGSGGLWPRVAATEEDRAALSRDFRAMVDAGSDNARNGSRPTSPSTSSIYLATHNEFFWPIGQLFSFGLRQMFSILAQGTHRPRAIVEHGDLLRAILERKPAMARAAAPDAARQRRA